MTEGCLFLIIVLFCSRGCLREMPLFHHSGRSYSRRRGIFRYSTDASCEEPIRPPVDVTYTQLLINGQFVDAAAGKNQLYFLLFMTVGGTFQISGN